MILVHLVNLVSFTHFASLPINELNEWLHFNGRWGNLYPAPPPSPLLVSGCQCRFLDGHVRLVLPAASVLANEFILPVDSSNRRPTIQLRPFPPPSSFHLIHFPYSTLVQPQQMSVVNNRGGFVIMYAPSGWHESSLFLLISSSHFQVRSYRGHVTLLPNPVGGRQ